MIRSTPFKIAFSALALAVVAAGTSVSADSGSNAVNPARAARSAERASDLMRDHHADRALRYAEDAVALDPANPAHRAMLGQVYLSLGRFASAEQSFADATTLGASDSRTVIGHALSMIANAHPAEAVQLLDAHAQTLPASDYALALAVAGQPERGALILTDVVRSGTATARDRQNLALAFSLAGRWLEARLIAAQDLGLDHVGERMAQWGAMAQAPDPRVRIAALIGTQVSEDSGLPVRLALATTTPAAPALALNDTPAPIAFANVPPAEAAPAPVAASAPVVAAAPVAAPAAAPVAAPVQLAAADPVADAVPDGAVGAAGAAPAAPMEVAMASTTAPTTVNGIVFVSRPVIQPLRSLVAMVAPLAHPDAPVPAAARPVRVAGHVAPAAAAAPVEVASAPVAAAPRGPVQTRGWAVQLGAYESVGVAQNGWASLSRRHGTALAGRDGVTTSAVVGGKTVYRLAATGFASRSEAAQVCARVSARGGNCFVRQIGEGEPVRWASRQTSTRVASR